MASLHLVDFAPIASVSVLMASRLMINLRRASGKVVVLSDRDRLMVGEHFTRNSTVYWSDGGSSSTITFQRVSVSVERQGLDSDERHEEERLGFRQGSARIELY